MAIRRRKLVIGLCALVVILYVGIFFASNRSGANRIAFENIRDGMTVDEAFAAMNSSRDKWYYSEEYFGLPVPKYEYQDDWWIQPRYEYGFGTSDGKVVSFWKREMFAVETRRELIWRLKAAVFGE